MGKDWFELTENYLHNDNTKLTPCSKITLINTQLSVIICSFYGILNCIPCKHLLISVLRSIFVYSNFVENITDKSSINVFVTLPEFAVWKHSVIDALVHIGSCGKRVRFAH